VRRGELWTYVRPSRPDRTQLVVITSSDGVNDSPRPWLLGCRLRDTDPGDILAIPVRGHGWAYVGDLSRLLRAWFGERAGQLDSATLRRLDNVLRVAQDL
jgi:mRNA interferase MazF